MRYGLALILLVTVVAAACGDEEAASPITAPTATAAAPEPTATLESAVESLALIREGDVWLVQADGRGERRLNLMHAQSLEWITPTEVDAVVGGIPGGHLLVGIDGSRTELPLPLGGSWSRDGQRYVAAVDDEVVIYDRQGTELDRLEVTPPAEYMGEVKPCGEVAYPGGPPDTVTIGRPVFAPDGRSIFVTANCLSRVGANTMFKPLLELPLGGGPARTTSIMINTNAGPRFSPDGQHMGQLDAFHLSACAFAAVLTVADADGSNGKLLRPAALVDVGSLEPDPTPPPVPSGGVVAFDWSPRSDAVVESVNVSLCPNAASRAEPFFSGLFILGLDGSEERLVEGSTTDAAWSPSGRYVAYRTARMVGQAAEATSPVSVLDLNSGESVELGVGAQPAWQPQD